MIRECSIGAHARLRDRRMRGAFRVGGSGSGGSSDGLFGPNGARHEITEALTADATGLPAREERAKFVFDFGVLDDVLENSIQARAGGVPTEPELVSSRSFADEGDFRHVRTC